MARAPKVSCWSDTGARLDVTSGPIEVGSSAWFEWLDAADTKSFSFDSGSLQIADFTARREVRKKGNYWYGYKRIEGKLCNGYIGLSQDVTLAKLLDFGRQLNNGTSYTPKPQDVTQQSNKPKNCSRESYTSKPQDVTHPEDEADSDLDEKDDLLDDPREPSHAEVERSQARRNHELLIDNRMLKRELEAERDQLNQLRQAHNELISQKVFWTLEIVAQSRLQGEVEQLRSQLAAAQDELLLQQSLNGQIAQERDELGGQLDQVRAQLAESDRELERFRFQPAPIADPGEIASILVNALTLKANAGGAIKREIQRTLELLKKRSPKIE